MMRFVYDCRETLPPLAWCAILERDSRVVRIVHGPWVETWPDFFVEGAWEGDFLSGQFDSSLAFMGTGGRLRDDKVVFCAPCHPQDRLHVFQTPGQLFLSPSLSFLLKASSQRLDFNYIPYHGDFISFVMQMENHVGSVPLQGGQRVQVYLFRNLEIGSDLNIQVHRKKEPSDFQDYESYRRFLVESLQKIIQNAGNPQRRIRYSPISTISSGYDSPCCAALASEVGCREAVTFRNARSQGSYGQGLDDSGSQIGQILGLRVKEYDRETYRRKGGYPEAEFVACGDQGQDLAMTAFEEDFRQRLVITGVYGDVMWGWEPHFALNQWLHTRPRRDIIRHEPGLCSLVEFRFRVGFIHVPLAFLGALSYPSVHRITRSREMEPWRLGSRYDRPIARRILEEKGVPRHLFGQKKKATTVLLNRHPEVLGQMSPQSAHSFETFYQQRKASRKRSQQVTFEILYRLHRIFSQALSRVNRGLAKLGVPVHIPCPIPTRFSQCPGRPSMLVHWGIAMIESRYEIQAGRSEMTGPSENTLCEVGPGTPARRVNQHE